MRQTLPLRRVYWSSVLTLFRLQVPGVRRDFVTDRVEANLGGLALSVAI